MQTDSPATVGSEEATLSGTIDPHGTEVTYYFEYGLTPGYGMSTAQASAGSGSDDVEVSQAISGLSPQVVYHYRLVAVHGLVKQYGGELTFTTPSRVMPVEPLGPVSPITPPVSPVNPPAPAPGGGGTGGGPSASVCPKQTRSALSLSADATKKAARAALAAAPERYKGLNVKGAKVLWSRLATKAGPRGSEVAHQCDRAIQAKTVVVELRFPRERPSASLAEGVVFVSRFKGGYQVWEVAH